MNEEDNEKEINYIYELYRGLNEIITNSDPEAIKKVKHDVPNEFIKRETTILGLNLFEKHLLSMTLEEKLNYLGNDITKAKRSLLKEYNYLIEWENNVERIQMLINSSSVIDEEYFILGKYTLTLYGETLLDLLIKREREEKYTAAEKSNTFGCECMEKKEYPSALKHFENSKKLSPKYAPPYINSSILFRKIENYEEALKEATKATTVCPRNNRAWYQKALVLGIKGEYEKAKEAIEVSLTIDFEYEPAMSLYNKLKSIK